MPIIVIIRPYPIIALEGQDQSLEHNGMANGRQI